MKKNAVIFIIAIILITTILVSCNNYGKANQEYSDNYRNYYEIFVRSFYDSDGDGIGDIKGVSKKLDYICNALGADGIWLMPIMPSPSYHKYDVTDYYSIDPQYGTLEDFDILIAEAHKRDTKVIIDLVINHTSDMIPWFREAIKGLWNGETNKYTDYYNFTTEYMGSGYTKITDDYYYESRFTSQMPDLNLDNANVRDEILNIIKFWIDRGVDGFRLDAVTSYYTGNETKNTEFMKWLNNSAKAYKSDVYFVGEAWTTKAIITDYYESGIDSFFNYPFSQIEGNIVRSMNTKRGEVLAQDIEKWNNNIKNSNTNSIDAPFLSNHDNARSAGFLMTDITKKKMAAAIYLLMPGNPFIYYGEEIGMTGSGNDPNKRLAMLWSNTETKGTTFNPPGSDQTISNLAGVDEQLKDKDSLLNYYKKILTEKKKFPEIARGEMVYIDSENPEVCAYGMTLNESTVIVIHNMGDSELKEELAMLKLDKVKIKSSFRCDDITSSPAIKHGVLILPPYSTTILK